MIVKVHNAMKSLKHFFVAVLLSVFSVIATAQSLEENPAVRSALDQMFEHLDKSKVPTGILLDYGIDLLEFENFNGSSLIDSNYVDVATMESMLRSVKSSCVSQSVIGDVSEIMSSFSEYVVADRLDVGIAVFKYNYIKSNALDDNLIDYVSDQVYDVYENGVWKNPYGESYVLGFTPEANYSKGGQVQYMFSSSYLWKNVNIAKMEFDADDGRGYVSVNDGTSISVVYTEEGAKELRLRVTLDTGEQLVAHSYIVTEALKYDLSASRSTIPDDKWEVSTVYGGTEVTARVSLKYAPGNSVLKKPFIVVEGFDPWRLTAFVQSDDTSEAQDAWAGFTGFGGVYSGFGQSGLNNDYDFIYIDWKFCEADIRANAKLLEKIIADINGRKAASGSVEKNVILAQSMGGLIARYALCSMENSGIAHETATFITHDTPHLGANVPLGMLYGFHQLISLYGEHLPVISIADYFIKTVDIEDMIAIAYYYVHSMSVRQMLRAYVDKDGYINLDDYWDFQDELQAIGFPEGDTDCKIDNIAIVNGGTFDQSYLGNIGNHYIYLSGYAKASLLGNIILAVAGPVLSPILAILNEAAFIPAFFLGSTKLNLLFEVNPFFSQNSKLAELNITYTKRFLWIFKSREFTIFSSVHNAPNYLLPYDAYPGSIYSFAPFTDDEEYTNVTYYEGGWLGKCELTFQMASKFMFIPVASALCVKQNGMDLKHDNYTRDYYVNPPESMSEECPFSGFYLNNEASTHIGINQDVFTWLKQQIDLTIEGDDIAVDGTKYSVSGYSGTIKWRSSDESVAQIDDATGVISAVGNGFVTIMAEYYNNGKKFCGAKDVMVGFSPLVLNFRYSVGDGYTVSAICVDSDYADVMDNLAESGDVVYKWGVKYGDGDIQWTESSERSYVIGLPDEDEDINVFLRMVDSNGNEGKVYSIVVNAKAPYAVLYPCVIVNKSKEVFFIKESGYDLGYPNSSFILEPRHVSLDPTDNPSVVNECYKGTCYLSMSDGQYQLQGTRLGLINWSFDFFDAPPFLQNMALFMSNSSIPSIVLKITVENGDRKPVQIIPFLYLRKDNFPEVE